MSEVSNLAMIAAVGPDLELGSGGDLVWHISEDLKNFKRLTMGHPVIMGRKTWESLPKRPLPGRLNVVLTHGLLAEGGALRAGSVGEAIDLCRGYEAPFVIGGEQIYRAFMPSASVLYLTHVDGTSDKKIDAWFPEYRDDWQLDRASDWHVDSKGVRFRFETWVRK